MSQGNVIEFRPRTDLDALAKAAAELSSGQFVGGYIVLYRPDGSTAVTPLGNAPAYHFSSPDR